MDNLTSSADFSSFLGCSRYDFGVDAQYINVTSIEQSYAKIYGHHNQNCVFVNWLDLNTHAIEAAFDHLQQSGDVDINILIRTVQSNIKVDYLVRWPINQSAAIHPLVAIMFTLDISPEFRVIIISRIAGMIHKDVISNYIKLADISHQTNIHWQSIINEKNTSINNLHQESFLHKQRADILTNAATIPSYRHRIMQFVKARFKRPQNGFCYKKLD